MKYYITPSSGVDPRDIGKVRPSHDSDLLKFADLVKWHYFRINDVRPHPVTITLNIYPERVYHKAINIHKHTHVISYHIEY